MSSDPIEVLRKLEAKLNRLEAKYREAIKGRDAADPLTNHRLGLSEGFGVAAMCVRDALASLSAPKRHKRPKGNTPIEELMAEYEADGCDHSNMVWVRAAAQRYVETMEDSQVRCLLHVLSAPKPPSMNDNAVAVNESAPVNDKPESAEAVLRAAAEYHYAQAANPTDQFGNTSNHRNPKLEAWHRQVADAITSITAPPRPEASESAPVWSRTKPTHPGVYGVRGFNLGREPEDQFEAIVSVRLVGGELLCNLHESTSEDDFERWSRVVEDNSDSFEWCEFVPASAPVGVEGLPSPIAVKYPDSGLRDDANALSLWNAHGYDTGGQPLYSADQLHSYAARRVQLAQQPAAVDEAMVERAAEAAWLEFKSGLEERSWERAPAVRKDRLRIIVRTALTAALAGQEQGGTPE